MKSRRGDKPIMLTNLSGRVRHTPLPVTSGLLPLYEAVVNSIHAIEEFGISTEQGRITIEILRRRRQPQLDLADPKKRGPDALEDIQGFKISDNGIGFTEANMVSFRTLDSEYKADRGGRGIGRLLWLKAFNRVVLDSVFQERSDVSKRRSFVFDAASGVSKEHIENASDATARLTSVHLDGFNSKYRDHCAKTPTTIAESILEHCLWYFIRAGSAPLITVLDNGEKILLQDIFDSHMHSAAISEAITIKNREFNLIHVRLRSNSLSCHAIAFCADNRLVIEERVAGKIPGLHGRITDKDGEFIYSCYVSSSVLDECARPERTGFDMMENVEGLLARTEISLNDIRNSVIERAKQHLSAHLAENMKLAKARIETFVSHRAPRYRPILSRIPDDQLNVDPGISDKELDLTLHKHLAEIEGELLNEGHEVMVPKQGEDLKEYSQRLTAYLQKAQDIKKSDLANYVSHRKVILDLLTKAVQRGPDGKYAREDLIHALIMPMRRESREVLFDNCNLWLIDERLAFHDYLASDKSLASMPVTGSKDTQEPDICALNVFDNPILVSEGSTAPLASIVVIEIKRPMRDDAKAGEEKDPVEQAIGYLDRIRSGGVNTSTGRPIPQSEHIAGFCYVLCDLTPTLIKRFEKHHDFKRTADGMSYFGYKTNCNAYVEVVSFDRLVNAAKQRNRAFFDRLGLPTT